MFVSCSKGDEESAELVGVVAHQAASGFSWGLLGRVAQRFRPGFMAVAGAVCSDGGERTV